jgi:hypothetical protein
MKLLYSILLLALCCNNIDAQSYWHGKERSIRYQPSGSDFVITNGTRKFVRALYGTNTGFRVEAGDLPEFALYMPGMGGNFKIGVIAGNKSKWLTEATHTKATYRPGSMLYEIRDALLGNGIINLTILALADAEGMIIKCDSRNIATPIELVIAFGGATGKKFSRDGDIGADPESSFYLQVENCKDNSYTLGKNSFYLLYGSGKILTEEERYEIQHLPEAEKASSPAAKNLKQLSGVFPTTVSLKLADATSQQDPSTLYRSTAASAPVVTGKISLHNSTHYFLVHNGSTPVTKEYDALKEQFAKAEAARKKLASRVYLDTPDKYLNTLGGALSMAADAIWEDPSYLHGSVAWRMRLNAWRGAYVADPLGWHDRARKHFSSYALSQVTTPPVTGVVMDTALHLARHQEKIGTALFSDGYICRNPNGDIRAHHYDMNLVFVDQLLNHFNWTGDTAYVRQMWPLLKRHLAWEKRNFDADGDGLYDAYAAIWASDALQYSGGGVTHSSAYNYRANKTIAELASLIGEDGTVYQQEAAKIKAAVEKHLWLARPGVYAEYKDLLGKQLVHPSPGLWTIYHAIDAQLPDAFQAYQCLDYIDRNIPRIPVQLKGWNEKNLYLLSTSNWQPYTWSINNVALAENLHTSLAYWQGNRPGDAFSLWRSVILESMYASASPGGFQQLSFYDAVRGELYRDFADPIGMAGRTLVEGLFGIQPDALHDTLTIKPGYPKSWAHATLNVPDIDFSFFRIANSDTYKITQRFPKLLHLQLILPASRDNIARIRVNGKPVQWEIVSIAVNQPQVRIKLPAAKEYDIYIQWAGNAFADFTYDSHISPGLPFTLYSKTMKLIDVHDPQQILPHVILKPNELKGFIQVLGDRKTFFIQVKQGAFTWWKPVSLAIHPKYLADPETVTLPGTIKNLTSVDLDRYFNDKVTNIFKQQYLSPRPVSPTLQLPTQGIGNWCYPMITANIDDKGLRQQAGSINEIKTPDNISFKTPSDTLLPNIVFTSQWDNYPDSVQIPLSGSAAVLSLLMAGSTNPMQSRITNGIVYVHYTDGTKDSLLLTNPENWWPIEQDYANDGYAFTTGAPPPLRLLLKEGKFVTGPLPSYTTIRGFSNRAIDGGAATVLHMILNPAKTLQSMSVHAIANDVVIGLMAVTLVK